MIIQLSPPPAYPLRNTTQKGKLAMFTVSEKLSITALVSTKQIDLPLEIFMLWKILKAKKLSVKITLMVRMGLFRRIQCSQTSRSPGLIKRCP